MNLVRLTQDIRNSAFLIHARCLHFSMWQSASHQYRCKHRRSTHLLFKLSSLWETSRESGFISDCGWTEGMHKIYKEWGFFSVVNHAKQLKQSGRIKTWSCKTISIGHVFIRYRCRSTETPLSFLTAITDCIHTVCRVSVAQAIEQVIC